MERDDQAVETLAVHAGSRGARPEGSVVYPIYQGTVYESEPGESYSDIRYLRLSTTPTQRDLHARLAALEGAEAALAASSGMAAVSATLLSVLKAGDHLLTGDVLYGGTHSLLAKYADRLGWSCTLVDAGEPESWSGAVRPNTKAFLIESVTNPLVRVGDLRGVAEFARRNGLVSIIDNTFATPVNFRPLSVGYDLVLHSATKYLGGHSDLVAGCVAGSAERVDQVRYVQNHFGGSLDPHAGFLLTRGLKTLAVRVGAQNRNGLALAEFLAGHPGVEEVNYPGLPSHPDHDRAAELFSGFGGMLSFRASGGLDAVERFLKALTIPYVAPSLGGVETLVTRPAATSHAGMTPSARAEIGITDDLVRVSCGIEAAADLIADFDQALAVS